MRAFAAAALIACLLTTSANAQPSLEGMWAFETSPHRVTGCVIRGQGLLRPQARDGDYDVTLHAAEQCPDGSVWRAQENCTARRSERTLRVSCTLVRAEPDNYNADHFSLTIESAELMRGRLIDFGAWNEPVHWRRTSGALVS